jgi:hypothetical protein
LAARQMVKASGTELFPGVGGETFHWDFGLFDATGLHIT